ncbi:MAG: sensor histidine kinase, partial [Gammaproteobacteria bacterium]|nr:sensor histidine kinase [Gammaproteobacteria bacterium]
MTGSLSARLLIAVSVVLALFFGATVVVLDLAFRHSAERAVEDRLDVQIFLLLAEAEPTGADTVLVPEDLPEPRFASPGSGLYGQINDASGELVWRSDSAVGVSLPMPASASVGEHIFFRSTLANDERVFVHTLMVEWEFDDGTSARYQFGVAESFEPYLA